MEILKGRHPHPYTLRRNRKSVEATERKADTRRPSRKRVRKNLKIEELNKRDENHWEARESGLGFKSVLELGKHTKG